MKANLSPSIYRFLFNIWPSYRGSGGRVKYISTDWKEVHVSLRKSWRTRNYVGSVFGGSIYSCADPIYMLQLMKILGDRFVVWDKSANVKFIKPIYGKVKAEFHITDDLLDEIKLNVAEHGKYVFEITTQFKDDGGQVFAEVCKVLYVADKAWYKAKKGL